MKRLFALLLCLIFALGTAAPAFAAEIDVPEETPEPPQLIKTPDDLRAFSEGCSLESYSRGRVFSLEADLTPGADFAPIPYFAGTFLGNGHTISGLELRGDGSRLGFFRQLSWFRILFRQPFFHCIIFRYGTICGEESGQSVQ